METINIINTRNTGMTTAQILESISKSIKSPDTTITMHDHATKGHSNIKAIRSRAECMIKSLKLEELTVQIVNNGNGEFHLEFTCTRKPLLESDDHRLYKEV